jgi:hypothetical protein
MASATNHWWENWPQSFGYVCGETFYPRSLPDLVAAVQTLLPEDYDPLKPPIRIKAIGGGWSFTDATLPLVRQADVDAVSIQKAGANGSADLSNYLQGLESTFSSVDLFPETIDTALPEFTHYDQQATTQETSGYGQPSFLGPQPCILIDTRGLASSLQQQLPLILSAAAQAQVAAGTQYFHVEAGITMTDLQSLLDHQQPRLALQATGGNPLATLAGSLSTATHGGEWHWPLLTDRVRAIHLVGPGGEEWWIEGGISIADQAALQTIYPNLDTAHFVGGSWNGVSGLGAQDALEAVTVSMGTMGIIYSVVLEVVPQFGLQQIIKPTSWANVLAAAATTEALLSADTAGNVNLAVLNVLLDGALNGTGIPKAQNTYADLAINPITLEAWITNRQLTPQIPINPNNPSPNYFSAFSNALSRNAQDSSIFGLFTSPVAGRIFDFLNYGLTVTAAIGDAMQAFNLLKYVLSLPDPLAGALAMLSAQAVANQANEPSEPDRGQQFLGDFLTGMLNALSGTTDIAQFSAQYMWTGHFSSENSIAEILVYNPSDPNYVQGRWWLGTVVGLSINWKVVWNTATPVTGNASAYNLVGNFSGGPGDQVFFFDPNTGMCWTVAVQDGWLTWEPFSSTTPFNPSNSNPTVNWRVGNFLAGYSSQQILVGTSDGNLWLGATNSWGALSIAPGSPAPSGAMFFGNFTDSSVDQILAFDGSTWWLGTINSSGQLQYASVSTSSPVGTVFLNALVGNFTGSSLDQILINSGDDWWLGTFDSSGMLNWPTSPSGNTSALLDLAGPSGSFWSVGMFASASDQVLIYSADTDQWAIGSFDSTGAMTWALVANNPALPFDPSYTPGFALIVGNFLDALGPSDLLVYRTDDGSWWIGTLENGDLAWNSFSNTTVGAPVNSDKTDVSYKVGAIGWPDSGIPGRGIEIAVDPSKAFSFLQNVILPPSGLLQTVMLQQNKPLIGYISVRICPPTGTLMGMQQFVPSVMIEVVGYRSPEADVLMDQIQAQALAFMQENPGFAMLHWGLENDQLTAADLQNTPLVGPVDIGSSMTKLEAFQAIRQYLRNNHAIIFDNNFTNRLGL